MNMSKKHSRSAYRYVVSSIVDPFYSREVIFFLLIPLSLNSYFSQFVSAGTIPPFNQISVISLISVFFFTAVLAYSCSFSASMGNIIGTGSLAFLFTMPVNRFRFYLVTWLTAILSSFFLYSIAFISVFGFLTFHIYSSVVGYYLLIILSSLMIYTSVGILLSILFQNTIIPVVLLIVGVLILSIYSSTLFPHYLVGQSLIEGLGFLASHPEHANITFYPSIFLILLSIFIFMISYVVSRFKNYRSGRYA